MAGGQKYIRAVFDNVINGPGDRSHLVMLVRAVFLPGAKRACACNDIGMSIKKQDNRLMPTAMQLWRTRRLQTVL